MMDNKTREWIEANISFAIDDVGFVKVSDLEKYLEGKVVVDASILSAMFAWKMGEQLPSSTIQSLTELKAMLKAGEQSNE